MIEFIKHLDTLVEPVITEFADGWYGDTLKNIETDVYHKVFKKNTGITRYITDCEYEKIIMWTRNKPHFKDGVTTEDLQQIRSHMLYTFNKWASGLKGLKEDPWEVV